MKFTKTISVMLIALSSFIASTLYAQDHNLSWPPKKFPVNIPFKVLNDIQYWEIQSIVCIGTNQSGYRFKIKGKGLADSPAFRLLSIAPEEKGSNTIKSSTVGSYTFPSVKEDETFEFEITALFSGYYNKSKFAGFLIFPQ